MTSRLLWRLSTSFGGLARSAVAATLAVALGACNVGSARGPTARAPLSGVVYTPVSIAGEDVGANIFDPSLEYAGSTGWLAYSDIEGDARPVGPYIHTNIARSRNAGQSWELVTRANTSSDAQITGADGRPLDGVWRYEVPALVHVPEDSAAPWKLFSHRYFSTVREDRMFQYGWIAVRSATDPAGPWGPEEALIGTAFTPFTPFSTRVNVAELDPSLRDVVVITEPGVLYQEGTIYLSVSGARRDGVDRIFLLASNDFGATWRFVANLLTRSDARRLGAARFDGSSLVEVAGVVFLLATPERNSRQHDGTSVFRFVDVATGALERADGALVVVSQIDAQARFTAGNRDGGQADYDEANTRGGVLFPQTTIEYAPRFFQIFQTGRDLRN